MSPSQEDIERWEGEGGSRGRERRVLRADLIGTLILVNEQMIEVREAALEMGISARAMRDAQGSWVLNPLLAAKAQLLYALALEESR